MELQTKLIFLLSLWFNHKFKQSVSQWWCDDCYKTHHGNPNSQPASNQWDNTDLARRSSVRESSLIKFSVYPPQPQKCQTCWELFPKSVHQLWVIMIIIEVRHGMWRLRGFGGCLAGSRPSGASYFYAPPPSSSCPSSTWGRSWRTSRLEQLH